MTREFFKELCRFIKSEVLNAIPDGECLLVFKSDEYRGRYTISCAGYKYTHDNTGAELIEGPEGLDDEED